MKARAAYKLAALSRQQLTQHLLAILIAPDLDVDVELVGTHHNLSRQRAASADADHRWLYETVEYDGRQYRRDSRGHLLWRRLKNPDCIIQIVLRGTLQMRPF